MKSILTILVFLNIIKLSGQDCPNTYNLTIDKMHNVCYEGVDNIVTFSYYSGESRDTFSFNLSHGEIIKVNKFRYILRFQEAGSVNINYQKNNKLISSNLIRVKKLPDPIFYVLKPKETVLAKDSLSKIYNIVGSLPDFDFYVRVVVTKYTINIIRNGNIIYSDSSTGSSISNEIKNQILNSQKGDMIKFDNIEFNYESDEKIIKKGEPAELLYLIE